VTLSVAPCSHAAAQYAVSHWHYSKCLPPPKLFSLGVWEGDEARFVGAVVYSRGATQKLVSRFGLDMTEGCELVRVALRDHLAPVSQVVAESLRQLKRANPGLRLVVSFADPYQGHHGGIYQAGNWIYAGETPPTQVSRDAHHSRVVQLAGGGAMHLGR